MTLRFHMDDPLSCYRLGDALSQMILELDPHRLKPIVLCCIGTDRSTGDSLGPLVGTKITTLSRDITVVGTLDDPMHAANLSDRLNQVRQSYGNPLIIAVDACLGKPSSIGAITLQKGALRPGAGVKKDLPAVGDISITGIVNVGGFAEFLVLQNTRLSVVMKLSQRISLALILALQRAGQPLVAGQ